MKLYNDFASHYDFIFPVNERTLGFLEEELPSGTVVDLGCATGGYAIALAGRGYVVEGLDLDAHMLEIATGKGRQSEMKVTFQLKDIAHFAATSRYDGIYSIGNTIVHLPDKAAVKDLLARIYDALIPHGKAVVQIINYDRFIGLDQASLPTIEREGRRFTRFYRRKSGMMLFETELNHLEETYRAVTPLLPLLSFELASLFQEAGFVDIRSYGGFSREPYESGKSQHFVIVAGKPTQN